MEKYQALKMILDKLMKEDKLDMWTMFGEKSGSIMVKMRFQGTMGDNESDDEAQNSDVMFKRKSDKQIMRDINRLKSSSESKNVEKSENCDAVSKIPDQGETPCVIEQNECAAAKDSLSSQSDFETAQQNLLNLMPKLYRKWDKMLWRSNPKTKLSLILSHLG